MKIAISTNEGFVSMHFGRCPSYTIFEIEDGNIIKKEEIPNPGHQPGFLPQYLSELGINCIVAGGIGSRAQLLFSQENIEVITGAQGTIDKVIEQYINNDLETGEDLCSHDHWYKMAHSEPCTEHVSPTNGDKICITSEGKDLGEEIDPNFGRARYFLIVDPEMLSVEAIRNPNSEAIRGAGIQSAQLISNKNVGTVLTGRCGPNAQKTLQSSNIKVITGFGGKALDALSKYQNGIE